MDESSRERDSRGPTIASEHEGSRGKGSEAVRVWLLGGFKASVGTRTIGEDAWRLKKAAAIVKLLALASGHRLHREQIMDILWPDSGRRAASNNLRKTLHSARRTLDPAAGSLYLASQDESLVLCPGGDLWVDVDAFEDFVATARRTREPAAYKAAIEFYAGDLLPEDRYEEWAEDRREELRHLRLALLADLAKLNEAHGDLASAAEVLRETIADEPTSEEAHQALMRLHALAGRESDALAQYERLRETLSRQLDTEPSTKTRELREDIAAGRLSRTLTRPAHPSREYGQDAAKHNLPAPRSSFVGREQELVEIERALAMTRLLTLTGAGGSGKTRLALEVARQLAGSYPDGVWLVELAPLSEGGLVAQETANALGVRERPGQPLTDTLVEVLAEKTMLLVIDNCEHLVEDAARLVNTLLVSCPRLRVMATSREPLAVPGEVNWIVPPLSLPVTTNGESTVEVLVGCEAVRLFVDRARQRLLDFEVTQENAGAVATLCRKLDGIPLAIELATARMGTLAIEQIAQRLESSIDVLRSGSRTAAPRQRTLKATLDWSYGLLSEAERALLQRLSVFAGGWTLETAETVCSGGSVQREDVLDLLGAIVDKSLVVAASTGGAVRYRMLESVRQYITQKSRENGEANDVRDRHAEFFAMLAEEAEAGLLGARQGVWLDRLQTEHDNSRVALSWALGNGDAELGLRIAGSLLNYWAARGHYDEGRRWLEAFLAQEDEAHPLTQAKALETVGWLAQDQGDLERADAAASEGLELSVEAKLGLAFEARFIRILEMGAWHRGDYARTRELAERSLALFREAADRRGMAWSLNSLASVASAQGDGNRALELSAESLALARELGGTDPLDHMLLNSGYEFLLQGDYERALALNEEAAVLARKQGNKYKLHYSLDNLGWAALMLGDYRQAGTQFRENLVLCQELGDTLIASESLEGLGCILGAGRKAEQMAKMFGAAETLRETVGFHQSSVQRTLREPYLAAARSQLDEGAWETAFAQGQNMTFEEALEYALASEERSPISTPVPKKLLADKQTIALTRREEAIALRVAQGLTNRQIASKLVISEHTVATHVRRILKKLGLRSRAQIGSWVTERLPTADPN